MHKYKHAYTYNHVVQILMKYIHVINIIVFL